MRRAICAPCGWRDGRPPTRSTTSRSRCSAIARGAAPRLCRRHPGRDLLVVPVVGDAPFTDGWVSPLNEAVYPSRPPARPADGRRGRRSSATASSNDPTATRRVLRPCSRGLHQSRARRRALRRCLVGPRRPRPQPARSAGRPPREPDRQRGVRRRRGRDARRLPNVGDPRASAVAAASQPSLHVTTVSEWAAGEQQLPGGGPCPMSRSTASAAGREDGRPSGTRFGALVHAVLAGVALDAERHCGDAARTQARLLGAGPKIAAAGRRVTRVLASPWIRRAAASGECRREVPLTISDSEDEMIEGVADLVFEEAGAWVVVEFKTDVEIGRPGLERYRRQVELTRRPSPAPPAEAPAACCSEFDG